jgi:phosphinothricin acetyltransferase
MSAAQQFTIRPARVSDAAALARIYNVSVLHSVATFQTSHETETRRREWLLTRSTFHPAFVAETLDGAVMGWGALSPYCLNGAWSHTVEDSIYLDAIAQRQGLGARLLARLITTARTVGHRIILARIVAGHSASIGLHAKLGFSEVGRLRNVGYKFDQWHDVVYMQLDLGVPPAMHPKTSSEKSFCAGGKHEGSSHTDTPPILR